MKLLNLFIVTLLMFIAFDVYAQQAPAIEWAKAYGGSGADEGAYSIVATDDGGFIVAGQTESTNGDLAGRPTGRGQDVWLIKLNDTGAIAWQKYYGGAGSGNDRAKVVRQTSDGGYVIGATTFADNGGDITDKRAGHGGDYWIIKTDDTGKVLWSVTRGSQQTEELFDLQQTADGGYIVAGRTGCFGSCAASGDVTRFAGNNDYWVVKLNSTGGIVWQKTYGGSESDVPAAVKQTADGGYIVVGNTESSNGDVQTPTNGFNDYWIIKLNDTGKIEWQKTYGGTAWDYAYNVIQNASGNYIVVGASNSDDGDINGFLHGADEYWVLALDDTGKIEWQYTYGSSKIDKAYDIVQTADKGYVISGYSMGDDNDGDKTYGYGNHDYWLVKTDSAGILEWEKSVPGNGQDFGYGLAITADGGYVMSGTTRSSNAVNYHAQTDLYIARFAKANIDSVDVFVSGGGTPEITVYGGTLQLEARVYPAVSSQAVTWSIVNGTGVATIDPTGLVTAQQNGTVWAKAVAVDDITKSDSIELVLSGVVPVDSVVVTTQNNEPAEIGTENGTLQLDATVYPVTADQSVTWSIASVTGNATVDANGVVTAQSDGTVWAKAVSVSDPAKSDSLLITITEQLSVAGMSGEGEFYIYPNPAEQTVYLAGVNVQTVLSVTITDVYGRVLKRIDLPAGSTSVPVGVDISSFVQGVYIFHIKGDEFDVKQKVTRK